MRIASKMDQEEPLLGQTKSQVKLLAISSFTMILFLTSAAAFAGFHFFTSEKLSKVWETSVGVNPLLWNDVGTSTPLPLMTKSVKFTKQNLIALVARRQQLPGMLSPPNAVGDYTVTNMFGDNDQTQDARYIIPFNTNRAAHLDFPATCNNGEIVATDAAVTSCSLIIGNSPKNQGMLRGYHDMGYVVGMNNPIGGSQTYSKSPGNKGFMNFPDEPQSVMNGLEPGQHNNPAAWHYRPALQDNADDLGPDEYLVVDPDLSFIYYKDYTWNPNPTDTNFQVNFWALKCINQQWTRLIYHFTYPRTGIKAEKANA